MPVISTRDLLLREIVFDDWVAMHAYAKDPEVVRFEPWGPNTEEESRAFVEGCLESQLDEPRDTWELAVVLRETGALIGGAALHVDHDLGEGRIAYTFARAHWGRGYATQAARALVSLGLDTLGLRRIVGECAVANGASARVLEKAGLTREARFRENRRYQGVWQDTYLYAILASDPRPPSRE